ncbi:hypothetical protein [Candidatus Rariloculus sp.]|uniref:hypothetical protein n=1 Tax=Candidatus Rariloculus sp. TaxID=3101265 RepID=UPI003D0E0C64
MDRSPFGATPRLRCRRTATVATVVRVRGWIAAQVSRAQAREIRRRVSVSPRILAAGTGDVWTTPPYQSLGGPGVTAARISMPAWLDAGRAHRPGVFAPTKAEGVAVPRHD